ncbi:MAG: glycosyltransferase family 4 protein [Chloroflexi bacterium]|nr:glycosyltransferase family 4 protein [Chloroflexota bacterium]
MGNTMIRVAHIITRFHGAGGAKNTLFTCAGLDKNRYEVDLVVGRSADRWRAEGAGVNWVQIDSMVRAIHPLQDARSANALLRLIRERRYHIVHTHLAKAGMLGRWAARRAGTPIIIHTVHGATFSPAQSRLSNALYLMLERRAAKWTDVMISVGDDLRRRYLAAGVGRPEQYVIIHSGMDLSAFLQAGREKAARGRLIRAELGLSEQDFVAGYVAALEWRKGHHHIVEAARRLRPRYPQLHFLFVGEGFDRPRIEALVNEAGLGDRIHFTGYRTDVADVMAAFDVKLFASNREGLPQVLVQAAAVGLPVIAFEAEGVCELVHDGVNGYHLAYGDVNGMVERLEHFILHPEQAAAMGARGPALVDDRWQIATMQRKTIELYETLLQHKFAS